MRLTTTRVFPLAIMFSLALLTFYLEQTVREEQAKPAPRRHDPDYIISNFTTTTYNREGRPLSVLSASQMLHYPDDDSTELLDPRIEQTKPDEPRITVTAERGALSGDGEEIFLYDNVVLLREATDGQPAARMTTSFLHVLRGRSLVRTDREVTFEEDNRRLSGRGMEYNSDSRQLQLFADVVGRYEPRQIQ